MAKYNWTVDTLQLRLDYLRDMYDKETDEEKKQMIAYDIECLDNYIDCYFDLAIEETPSFWKKFQTIKTNLQSLKFLWPDYNEFYEETINTQLPDLEIKKCSLSKDDLLTLTHDFYKSLNRYFFGNFMKNFRVRRNHIKFVNEIENDAEGFTTPIRTTKEAYIKICRLNTIEDYMSVVHEYGHAITLQINPYHLAYDKRYFIETTSIFMELLASDYYQSQTNNNDASINKINNHIEFIDDAKKIKMILSLMEEEKNLEQKFSSTKEMRKHLNRNLFTDDCFNKSFNSASNPDEEFLSSYIIAIELYMLYKEDKDKALDTLKRIILLNEMPDEEQYYSNIKRLGIIPNLSLRGFEKDLQAESLKLTRFKH